LLVTFTFSKAYGLAGLRVGFGVANARLINLLERFRLPFNINQIAMIAAKAALDDQQHVQNTIAINASGRKQLALGFTELGLGYIPSQTNFLMVDFASTNCSGPEIFNLLQLRGIIVRPLLPFGLTTWLRISIGLPEENKLLLETLAQILDSKKGIGSR